MMPKSLVERFLESLDRHPERPALELNDVTLSYRQLASRAEGVRRALERETSRSPLVGILADRVTETYPSVLGTLFAAKGYVPLSPSLPDLRLAQMAKTAGIDLVLGPASAEDRVASWRIPGLRLVDWNVPTGSDRPEPRAASPDSVAYLHFTSGSTGTPKAVPGSQRNAAHYLAFLEREYGPRPTDRVSNVFDLGFDPAVHDLFFAWMGGGCLCPIPQEIRLAPAVFAQKAKLTVWYSVPSSISTQLRLRALPPDSLKDLRLSLFCGEPFTYHQARAWAKAAPHSIIENHYGPTETTICVTRFRYLDNPHRADDDVVPIGRPFPGHTARLLGDDGNEVGENTGGEVYLSGPQVTLGYWNEPEKTEKVFVRLPDTGDTRWYRTGDWAKRDQRGELHFLGRRDNQIKVFSERIELEEVDRAIKKVSGADEAAAVLYSNSDKTIQFIIGFVTLAQAETDANEKAWLEACRRILPLAAIPRMLVALADFPRTSTGKIDRRRLAQIGEETVNHAA